jgi:hypothetical protein
VPTGLRDVLKCRGLIVPTAEEGSHAAAIPTRLLPLIRCLGYPVLVPGSVRWWLSGERRDRSEMRVQIDFAASNPIDVQTPVQSGHWFQGLSYSICVQFNDGRVPTTVVGFHGMQDPPFIPE